MSTAPDSRGITPADLAIVATYPGHRDAHDRGLVALSMGIPYWVLESEGRYHLLVEIEFHSDVKREVAAYDDEAAHPWSPLDPRDHASPAAIALAYLYCFALAAAFLFQKSAEPWSVETFGNGNLALFDDGQWWRPATALFLHGNLAHLLGNMAFGAWFLLLASRALGPAIAALAALLGGILGNTLSAAIYYPGERLAIGASTAVFATLGILVGHGLFESVRNHSLAGLASKLAPLGGGLALLALTGAGGSDGPGNTDLLAHVCGFLAGIPLGIVATRLGRRSY